MNATTGALVSVVIPTRNRLAFLKEAVRSVETQSLTRWELIVVDDDSTDATWQWLVSHRDPRVRVVRLSRRMERSAARNRGLSEVRTEYVVFLDDDDLLRPNALSTLLTAATIPSKPVMTVGQGRSISNGLDLGSVGRHPTGQVSWRELLFGWVPALDAVLFRSSAMRAAGGFDPALTFAEHQDIFLRVAMLGTLAVLPTVVVDIRTHSGQNYPTSSAINEATVREQFLSALRGSRRVEANRLLDARRHWLAAITQLHENDFRGANEHARQGILALGWTTLKHRFIASAVLDLWARSLVGRAVGARAYKHLRSSKKRANHARTRLLRSLRARRASRSL